LFQLMSFFMKLKLNTLIKRGGGKGPCETRQPVAIRGANSCSMLLRDKRDVE